MHTKLRSLMRPPPLLQQQKKSYFPFDENCAFSKISVPATNIIFERKVLHAR